MGTQIRPFTPRPMQLSLLTAALQELTPRDRRDADPDLAIEEWLAFARQVGQSQYPAVGCAPSFE